MSSGRAIVLNGTSSSGKTSLALAVQDRLEGWWLRLGVDTLITAMPARMYGTADGHTIGTDGSIDIGPGWRLQHDRWRSSIGHLLGAGADVVVDEVFLDGAADQRRWRETFAGYRVTWVGVHCDVEVASAREAGRGDRTPGLARAQAAVVHDGVEYDVVVDTTSRSPEESADLVVAHLGTAGPAPVDASPGDVHGDRARTGTPGTDGGS